VTALQRMPEVSLDWVVAKISWWRLKINLLTSKVENPCDQL